MASILNIATTSLNVFQQALSTTSNNIANAATDGYTRQRISLSSGPSERIGNGFLGSGVRFDGVQRVSDEFALLQLRTAIADSEANTAIFDQAVSMDSLLVNGATNVSTAIDQFFSSMQNLVDDPSYLPNRETLMSQGTILSESFEKMYTEFINQSQRIDLAITTKVDEVNTIAQSLAELNVKLSGSGRSAPDLLDQRDRLLADLSEIVSISTVTQSDGTLLVSVGNGQILVSSASATTLTASRNNFDPSQLDIFVGSSDITNQITGGVLGGLADFRTNVLDVAKNRLGRIAISLSDQFNTQHRMGMDLDGNLGDYFFRDMNDSTLLAQRASAHQNNAGTLDLSVSITDTTTLTDANYRLDWDGTNYTLTNLSDNSTDTSGTLPMTVDGFRINVISGTPTAGDSFLIRPTAFGANDISVTAVSPERIATAQPFRTLASTSNTGDVEISLGEMNDRTAYTTTGQPDLPMTITFTATNAYEIRDGSSTLIEAGITYNAAIENSVFPTPGAYDPGFRLTLKGDPQVGDTFSISANTSGVQDNRNALNLVDIPESRVVEGSRYNLQEAYGQIVTFVGNRANQADVNAQASNILLEQAENRISATSEVSLEEEAANLLLYQQLFTAASRLITTTSEVFNILNSALSR